MKLSLKLVVTGMVLVLQCVILSAETEGSCKAGEQLKDLQGVWKGYLVGGEAYGEITLTIKGNTLHYHRDEGHWFKTTFTLPKSTSPQQLHATIKECPTPDILGEVVHSIYKIENGMLIFVGGGDLEDIPESFDKEGGVRHEFSRAGSDSAAIFGPFQ